MIPKWKKYGRLSLPACQCPIFLGRHQKCQSLQNVHKRVRYSEDHNTIRTLKVGKPDYTKETPNNCQGMTFFPKSRPCKHWTGLVLVRKVPWWTPEFTARLQRCKLHTGQHLTCWSRAHISGQQAWKEVYITSGPSTERLNAHFCFVRSHSGRILSVVDGKARLHRSANMHGRILPQTMFAKLCLAHRAL